MCQRFKLSSYRWLEIPKFNRILLPYANQYSRFQTFAHPYHGKAEMYKQFWFWENKVYFWMAHISTEHWRCTTQRHTDYTNTTSVLSRIWIRKGTGGQQILPLQSFNTRRKTKKTRWLDRANSDAACTSLYNATPGGMVIWKDRMKRFLNIRMQCNLGNICI